MSCWPAARRFILLPRISAMLEDVFPGSQPDLNSLSKEAVLFINHGSPFTGDGLRYTLPQFNVLSIFLLLLKKP
jgi:hypothetical protein